MRLRRRKNRYVNVPPELEDFVEYLFKRGYNETTIAGIIEQVRAVMNGRPFETRSASTTRRRRYAWRHYQQFLELGGEWFNV